ncbi:MAG: glycerol-3-phosphate dehydrogenase (NAD(P)+) [Candidatus Deianiraeaceae bacterium]|jgi:glycerol-3-phosphate dehydrogenase (NAD(P)+)
MTVGIFGDGAMAQAIKHLLLQNNICPVVFSRKLDNIANITTVDIIFLCVPSKVVVEHTKILQSVKSVVSCAKGIADSRQPFISSSFHMDQFCVISGPNFTNEILANHGTITTIASKNNDLLEQISQMLSSSSFEMEATNDVVGVEICGIIKNIIAIMMGYASIKMPSWNEKSLILTKMFQEIQVILKHFECSPSIINLSCGIGDIFLTCSSVNSRNYRFGVNIAKGNNITKDTIEGVRSLALIDNIPVNTPYLQKVNLLLKEEVF